MIKNNSTKKKQTYKRVVINNETRQKVEQIKLDREKKKLLRDLEAMTTQALRDKIKKEAIEARNKAIQARKDARIAKAKADKAQKLAYEANKKVYINNQINMYPEFVEKLKKRGHYGAYAAEMRSIASDRYDVEQEKLRKAATKQKRQQPKQNYYVSITFTSHFIIYTDKTTFVSEPEPETIYKTTLRRNLKFEDIVGIVEAELKSRETEYR
jgi:hypothetical protein